ncbi:uncharacterized protein Rh7 [Eurosta solidaginis]|uniref:uncharacterized protein Rh7 n=1 Tax=Eurosta solidaginis TaxID=178769 RepID=UPI003530A432
MGSSSDSSSNSKSSKSAAEAVGDCMQSNNNNSCNTTVTTTKTKQQSKKRAEQNAVNKQFLLQKQLEQNNKIARAQINWDTKIEKVTPNELHEKEEEVGKVEEQKLQQKLHQQANVNDNNKSSCCHNIKFIISLNLRRSNIAIAVNVFVLLLLQFIRHTFVKMVTRHGHILAHGSRKRVNKRLNKNNKMNMYDITTIIGNNASGNSIRSNNNNMHTSTTRSYNNNNNKSNNQQNNNNNNNNNTNNFSTNTSRAIISVATTIASTSASIAIANMPTSFLAPTISTTTVDHLSIGMTAESYDNNWSLDSGSTWSTLNQSSTDKDVDLIEMDLANETLSPAYPTLRRYYGEYDVTYIAKVNPFWLQFDPPSKRTFYIMAIVYAILTSIGCLGNSLVIYMFLRCKSLRTPANTLVINLAVSDLLMLLKCPIAIYNNFKQGPALGDAACRIYGFLGGLSGTASIATLTAIALDRYNVVVHPLDPLRKPAKVQSTYIISIIWMYSFAFSIVPALDIGFSVYVPEGFLTTCSFDYLNKGLPARIFMFTFFVAAWCVPFTIICLSYFHILKVVIAANRIQSSKDKNKTEQKLALIVVGIIGLWFLAWTPYSIVAMLGVFGKEEYLTPLGSMIPALFCKTAACVDPYFYAATHPRFRMEFGRLLWGRGYLRRSSTTPSTYLTRSSARRLRVISDVDMRNRSSESAKKNSNLHALQEVTEENDEDYEFSIGGLFSDGIIEQSRF